MFKKLFVQTLVLSVFICISSSTSFAFDLSIFKNDKEAKSRAYNSLELKLAKNKKALVNNDKNAFGIFGDTLSEIKKKGQLCDLSVLQQFITNLKKAGIPATHDAIVDLLILWRDQDLIDDILFEIIEQSSALIQSISSIHLDKITKSESKKAATLMKKNEIKLDELAANYSELNALTYENLGCSANSWLDISETFSFKKKKTKFIRLYTVAARSNEYISPDAFDIAELLRLNDVHTWNITLDKYIRSLKGIKNTLRSKTPTAEELEKNPHSSAYKDKIEKTTHRQSLYYRFNSMQIGKINDLLLRTFDRMDSTKTEVVFTYKSGSTESVPVSPMGQYYMAKMLLQKDLQELSNSRAFAGKPVSHEDLITAALETGLLTNEMLKSALGMDDLWNPVVKPWKKIANYAFRVTGTATLFLPPPYNIISSIALVFIEGLIHRKSANPNAGVLYDFF
jgi:hypothetical protein